jgi:TRAP transporter 4TM/12TM fusion protein
MAWVLEVPQLLGQAFYSEQLLGFVYGFGLTTVFLSKPLRRDVRTGPPPWYDVIAAAAGFLTPIWVALEYQRLLDAVPIRTIEVIVIGLLILFLTLEALRRVSGNVLLGVVVVFLIYALVGHMVPGNLTATYVRRDYLLVYLTFDPSALFGTPLRIATTIVIAFIFMGQVLFKAGGGEFFTDLAQATTGRARGGSAKIAVVASAFFGTISGSPASNVTSTGVITIPLMKRSGYRGVDAGAIEAVASTGGQFMPPVMGAAAFLMAEFLEISYADVVIGAIVPSALYYLAVFIQVDLLAARDHIAVLGKSKLRTAAVLKQGWHFVLPLILLVWLLFRYNTAPELAALYASVLIIGGGFLRKYGARKLTFKGVVESFWETGLIVIELLPILAAAGLVIGVLNVTGGGFALTLVLVKLAGGSMLILLLVSAAVCIILGMGMPTTAVYVLLAALIAPALVEVGVQPFSAHLFILYYGMLSMITPPIALACFAAAVITREDPMKTAFSAMRFGWVAYVIPFMFVLSPTLLLDGDIVPIAVNIATAVIGVGFFSVALVGFYRQPLGIVMRILLSFSGVATILPTTAIPHGAVIVVIGLIVGGAILGHQIWTSRHAITAEDSNIKTE